MKCVHCGNEVTEGSKFCPFCGGKIDETAVANTAEKKNPLGDIDFNKAISNIDFSNTRDIYVLGSLLISVIGCFFSFAGAYGYSLNYLSGQWGGKLHGTLALILMIATAVAYVFLKNTPNSKYVGGGSVAALLLVLIDWMYIKNNGGGYISMKLGFYLIVVGLIASVLATLGILDNVNIFKK